MKKQLLTLSLALLGSVCALEARMTDAERVARASENERHETSIVSALKSSGFDKTNPDAFKRAEKHQKYAQTRLTNLKSGKIKRRRHRMKHRRTTGRSMARTQTKTKTAR